MLLLDLSFNVHAQSAIYDEVDASIRSWDALAGSLFWAFSTDGNEGKEGIICLAVSQLPALQAADSGSVCLVWHLQATAPCSRATRPSG